MQINTIHYKSSTNMAELKDNSIKLIITSPPYFNIKDYSQNKENYNENDIENFRNIFKDYLLFERKNRIKALKDKAIQILNNEKSNTKEQQ